MKRLVFIDAGVLIAATRGSDEAAQRAMQVLDGSDASFASSIFVKLDVLPKPLFHRKWDEVACYEAFFKAISAWANPGSQLAQDAYDEAARAGLSGMDALHVAAAAAIGADELVTTEKRTNPIHRATLAPVRTIVPAER